MFFFVDILSQQTRHEILYNSSASKNLQYTCFRKILVIFGLFRMTFHFLSALDYEENAKLF